MSRLIDADLLEPDADYDGGEYWAVSMTQIQNAPTIEPEIIRCKDCKWWDDSPSSTIAPTFHKCRGFENHHTIATEFCSRAERREE